MLIGRWQGTLKKYLLFYTSTQKIYKPIISSNTGPWNGEQGDCPLTCLPVGVTSLVSLAGIGLALRVLALTAGLIYQQLLITRG